MDRSSLTRTYDTSQRNKYIALAAGVVIFVGLWILIIVWLGQVGSAAPSDQASSQASDQASEQASGQAAPAAPATTAQETDDPEDTTAGESRSENEAGGEGGTDDSADTLGGGGEGSEEGGSQAAQSAGGGTQPSEVFDPLEEDGSTGETDEAAPESSQLGSDSGSQADLQTDPQTNPQTADYSPETDAARGDDQAPEVGENTEDEEQEEDTGQPSGAGTITDTDLARAKAASESYLTAAYGYTGTSAEDYLGGIEEAASEEVFGSPGGEKLEGYSEAAPACGMVSTVILNEFEVIGNGPEGLDALTTFGVEDADGQTHRFSQEHRLIFSEGVYQVAAVSVEELISNTTPRESCPGSANENPESPDDGSVQSGEDSEETGEELDAGEKEQVSSAADRFITAAYGYSGDSEEQYREAIDRTTVSGRFFESSGGGRIDGYAKRVGEEGMEAAAKMERFEITGVSGEDIEGVAYFEVGSSYDRYANVEGDTNAYRQPLTVSPYEGSYRVSAAGTEEQIANESSNESENERKLTK